MVNRGVLGLITMTLSVSAVAEPRCNYGETAKCEAWCERGDAGACYLFARSLSSGIGVPVDDARADLLFIDACAKRYGDACNAVGVGLQSGTPMTAAVRAMIKPYYENGCEYGSAKACDNLAALLRSGGDGDWVKYFVRSCELGVNSSLTGCTEAARAFRDGSAGVSVDKERAAELFAAGCQLGSTRQCTMATSLGKAVSITPKQAFSALENGCRLGDRGDCMNVANALEVGRGVPKDPRRALSYWELTCPTAATVFDSWGCFRLGRFHLSGAGGSVDAEEAVQPLKVACRFEEADACRALGDMTAAGQGAPASLEDARHFYERACGIDPPTGCHQAGALAKMTDTPSKMKLAELLFAEGCANGNEQSCRALGTEFPELVAKAKSVRVDRTGAECTKDGKPWACYQAAIDAWKNKDKEGAIRFAGLACRGGHAGGCEWYGKKHRSSVDKFPKALWALARSCALGKTKPCKTAKRLLKKESIDGEVRNNARAALKEACDDGFSPACVE